MVAKKDQVSSCIVWKANPTFKKVYIIHSVIPTSDHLVLIESFWTVGIKFGGWPKAWSGEGVKKISNGASRPHWQIIPWSAVNYKLHCPTIEVCWKLKGWQSDTFSNVYEQIIIKNCVL